MWPIFFRPTESAASSSGEYIAQTQTEGRLCKPKNVVVRGEEVSKINSNGGDAPMAVIWPSQLERSVKHGVRHV